MKHNSFKLSVVFILTLCLIFSLFPAVAMADEQMDAPPEIEAVEIIVEEPHEAEKAVPEIGKGNITLRGKVLDKTNGEGIAGIRISINETDGYGGIYGSAETTSATDGSYGFDKLAEGHYYIVAYGNDDYFYDEQSIVVTADENTFDLRMGRKDDAAYKISGYVTEEGSPLPGIEVKISSDGTNVIMSATSGEDGSYVLDGVSSGMYMLFIDEGEYDGVYYYGLGKGCWVNGEDQVYNMELSRIDNVIRGTVTDSGGNPINGIPVSIGSVNGDDIGFTEYTEDGYYEHRRVPNGTYKLLVSDGEYNGRYYRGETRTFTINGEYLTENFVLEQSEKTGYGISGTVTDASTGKPVPDAFIQITQDAGFVVSCTADKNGKYELSGLLGNNVYMLFLEEGVYCGTAYYGQYFEITIEERDKALNISAERMAPPSVSSPVSVKTAAGGEARFYAHAAGGSNTSYKWQVDKGKGFIDIPNKSGEGISAVYKISNVTPNMSGFKYRAVFTNLAGETKSKAAVLRVSDNMPAVSVSLSRNSATLKKGAKLKLIAKVNPDNATVKRVSWATSDKRIAVVDTNGVVTAKRPGTVKITVTSADGSRRMATCVITVDTP